MSFGTVFDEAFALYKQHWQHMMAIAATYYIASSAVVLGLTVAFGKYGALAGVFVTLVGAFWLTGALIEAVSDVRDGRVDLTLPETYSRILPKLPVLTGASILAGIGIGIGLFLLLVPGLILLTWWSLVTAAIVLEGKGVFASFGRSRELVSGHGWTVFGVVLVTFLMVAAASSIISAIFSFLPDWAGRYLGSAAGGTVTAPFQALTITVMYFKLARPVEPAPVTGLQPEPR